MDKGRTGVLRFNWNNSTLQYKPTKTMKIYILKYEVSNHIDFPIGTVVTITDDYFGKGTSRNTSFTVVEGKLKGEKGYVADGLEGWLIEDNPENRKLLKKFSEKASHINSLMKNLESEWGEVPTAIL